MPKIGFCVSMKNQRKLSSCFLSILRHFSTNKRPPKSRIKLKMDETIDAAFGKYILITNTVSSGILMFIGDLIEQEREFRAGKLSKRYDFGRLGRMFAIGLGFGPMFHLYYKNLNQLLPKKNLSTVISKVLFDQIFATPSYILFFFYGMGYLEGKTFKESTKEMKANFWEIYKMDWCFWPPVQFINFLFIPVHFQLIYINILSIMYNVFLSYVKHRSDS